MPTPSPTGESPRSSSRKKLGFILGGSAALAVVLIAVTVVVLRGSGGTGGGAGRSGVTGGGTGGSAGSGQTVDYVQFQVDVELGATPALSALDPLPQVGTGEDTLSSSDCQQAATDVGKLQADSSTWPKVLRDPMSQAESAFSAAATDCSNGDFTTMQTDMGRGHGFLSATTDAFAAHCRPTDSVTAWRC